MKETQFSAGAILNSKKGRRAIAAHLSMKSSGGKYNSKVEKAFERSLYDKFPQKDKNICQAPAKVPRKDT